MLIVSNYHYIREDFSAPYPSIFGLTPKQFSNQLEEFARFGNFISKEELLKYRERTFDGNYFLITFDDGLREQYELAKPVLDRLGIPFICFIKTANFSEKQVSLVHKIHLLRSRIPSENILDALSELERIELNQQERFLAISHYNYDPEETALLKYMLNFKMGIADQEKVIGSLFRQLFNEDQVMRDLYMDEQSLQDLNAIGALGSHSHTHSPLGQLHPQEIRDEIKMTQDYFRNILGKPSDAISYPYGSPEACRGIRNYVEDGGFWLGFTMERAINSSLINDSLMLARYDCNDLPLGKHDLFQGRDPFKNSAHRKWHLHENSSIDQQ